MAGLNLQPLELSDFSGGMTDNFLKGGPTRYEKAENFYLTVDHKLRQRNGQIIFSSEQDRLVSEARVGGLFTAINEEILFAHDARHVFPTPCPVETRTL